MRASDVGCATLWRRIDVPLVPLRPIFPKISALAALLPGLRGSPAPGELHRALPTPPASLKRSLRISIAEGMVAEVIGACTSNAMLTAWAIALHCPPLILGLLWSMSYLSQLVQFPAAWITSRFGARRVAIVFVSISRQLELPLVVLPFLGVSGAAQQWLFVAVTAISAAVGVVGNNAWVTWMGELVPARVRGRYFGRRTALCTLANTLGALGAGLAMDLARRRGLEREALAGLSLLACVLGAFTTALMRRQGEPRRLEADPLPAWSTLLEPWRDARMRRALTYNLLWNAAVGLAASFFQVHMAQNLGLSFLLISAHCAATALVRMVSAPAWGAAIDRVGARPVVALCSFGAALLPAMWLWASPTVWWPLVLDFILGGLLWGGHVLAIFQLPLRITPRRHRSFHLAAFSTAGGLAFSAAATFGGAVVQLMPKHIVIHGHQLLAFEVIFVASTVCRLGAAVLSLRLDEPGAGEIDDLVRLAAEARPMRRAARMVAQPVRVFHARRVHGAGAGESSPARMEK